MSGQINKEALFNEVKGSLFEYLVALKLAQNSSIELDFISGLDKNYLAILGQQDRMIRQFYPEMLPFLAQVSSQCVEEIQKNYGSKWLMIKLLGKFTKNQMQEDLKETDLLLVNPESEQLLLSLKLNKKSAYVNTKSAGVRSFLLQYFPYLEPHFQDDFSKIIDLEFFSMADALHRMNELDFQGNFHEWVKRGHSELPGDLSNEERDILKKYYARLSLKLHEILTYVKEKYPQEFVKSLYPLMGFSDERIKQVVCYHEFKAGHESTVEIHDLKDIYSESISIGEFKDTASVEINSKLWSLQIRIKPMNKFTTTAIKVNCAVKFKN